MTRGAGKCDAGGQVTDPAVAHDAASVLAVARVTLFTTESDGAHNAAHAGFVYMRFLPERGGATHAFQCCFGDRALSAANEKTGIMTCVFVCVN